MHSEEVQEREGTPTDINFNNYKKYCVVKKYILEVYGDNKAEEIPS
jgi:hypothetical protein